MWSASNQTVVNILKWEDISVKIAFYYVVWKIKDISILEFLNEEDYIALFENLDLELITNNISKSSSEINRILRNIDSQKRPVLLSALMICLYEKNNFNCQFWLCLWYKHL